MVEQIFHDLLKGKSHKTIFNEIYRFYLKNNTNDEIINLSIEIHNFIKKIREQTSRKLQNKSLIITELEDNKYDVNIICKENDSIFSLETLKLENLIDLEILAPPKLNEAELLGHIIWNYYEQHKRKII
tara:strand:+ start:3627 stop:4013 length:387 start_codon:yes stop_codon:yes gene_type:complete